MAEYTILLDALTVMIRLGIHAHEAEPQRVAVSVEMTVRYPAPIDEDAIEAVLDYDFVRTGILALADTRRFALQETLCETIAALCLGDERVARVRVRTMKRDVYPDAGIGCEIVRER
ncbi:dihydroneopterin aldolase [Sphingomonas oligophenolica]|uniref:Dihydroneopterin aldolase n=1 Tax=Sphingomonas oligophenolica TaxID=301154 RepID=A0A502CR73_9SPHN|nr:dihydroneopterin aldolase [Sphingomonas oligophenolica]TPG14619.1 dihydroneopterin aldolase [Sphingomonas oligophenolica]